MALTTEEKSYPNLVPGDRVMTWKEFVEWLRIMADWCEEVAKDEEARGIPESLRFSSPTCLYNWILGT